MRFHLPIKCQKVRFGRIWKINPRGSDCQTLKEAFSNTMDFIMIMNIGFSYPPHEYGNTRWFCKFEFGNVMKIGKDFFKRSMTRWWQDEDGFTRVLSSRREREVEIVGIFAGYLDLYHPMIEIYQSGSQKGLRFFFFNFSCNSWDTYE